MDYKKRSYMNSIKLELTTFIVVANMIISLSDLVKMCKIQKNS